MCQPWEISNRMQCVSCLFKQKPSYNFSTPYTFEMQKEKKRKLKNDKKNISFEI